MLKIKFKKKNKKGVLRKKISSTLISGRWNLYIHNKYTHDALYYCIPIRKKREFSTNWQ